ncbi:MAG: hypothetical protein BJ554DRAFT_2883, partial [Olpidium bornovanus]
TAAERVSYLEPLETVARLGLLADDVEDGVDKLRSLSVVAFGPVVSRPGLPEHEVVRPEQLAERAGAHGVHGAGFQVDQHGAGHVFSAGGFIIIDVDPLELQVGIAVVCSRRVYAVLVRDDLPELGPDLVAALARLPVPFRRHERLARERQGNGAFPVKSGADASSKGPRGFLHIQVDDLTHFLGRRRCFPLRGFRLSRPCLDGQKATSPIANAAASQTSVCSSSRVAERTLVRSQRPLFSLPQSKEAGNSATRGQGLSPPSPAACMRGSLSASGFVIPSPPPGRGDWKEGGQNTRPRTARSGAERGGEKGWFVRDTQTRPDSGAPHLRGFLFRLPLPLLLLLPAAEGGGGEGWGGAGLRRAGRAAPAGLASPAPRPALIKARKNLGMSKPPAPCRPTHSHPHVSSHHCGAANARVFTTLLSTLPVTPGRALLRPTCAGRSIASSDESSQRGHQALG